jgi:hypothetical protein
MKPKLTAMAVLSLSLLVLAACSSGGLGDVLGGGSSNNSSTVSGTVDSVDLNNHIIYLYNVSGYNNMLSGSGNSSTLRVYYDNNTTVSYNNTAYRPQDLERGDRVDVRVTENGSNLVADNVTVVQDVRTSSSTYPSSSYPNGTYNNNFLHGTVRSVDTYRHTIDIEGVSGIVGYNGGAGIITVTYPSDATIEVNGRTGYPISGLERGDIVDVQVDRNGNSYYANRIILARDVNQR